MFFFFVFVCLFFFQAEDGIRDLVRSRGLGDVYKRQIQIGPIERTFRKDNAGEAYGHKVSFRYCGTILPFAERS